MCYYCKINANFVLDWIFIFTLYMYFLRSKTGFSRQENVSVIVMNLHIRLDAVGGVWTICPQETDTRRKIVSLQLPLILKYRYFNTYANTVKHVNTVALRVSAACQRLQMKALNAPDLLLFKQCVLWMLKGVELPNVPFNQRRACFYLCNDIFCALVTVREGDGRAGADWGTFSSFFANE